MSDTDPAFEVTFACGNCGDSWSDEFPPRTVISDRPQVEAFNKDCDSLGTTSCDCCNVVICPTCEVRGLIAVDERSPIGGDGGL